MSHDAVMIMCPTHKGYPEPLKDQSHSELFDCPKCDNKMWLSEKKKGIILFAAFLDKEIILACYDCITKLVSEDPSLFRDSQKVDI